MNLKHILHIITFLLTTPLMAADVIDAALSSTSHSNGLTTAAPQESSKEWTREEKIAVFCDVQSRLTPHNLTLNEKQVKDQEVGFFSDYLFRFLSNIQNQILMEICKLTWLKKLDLSLRTS